MIIFPTKTKGDEVSRPAKSVYHTFNNHTEKGTESPFLLKGVILPRMSKIKVMGKCHEPEIVTKNTSSRQTKKREDRMSNESQPRPRRAECHILDSRQSKVMISSKVRGLASIKNWRCKSWKHNCLNLIVGVRSRLTKKPNSWVSMFKLSTEKLREMRYPAFDTVGQFVSTRLIHHSKPQRL